MILRYLFILFFFPLFTVNQTQALSLSTEFTDADTSKISEYLAQGNKIKPVLPDSAYIYFSSALEISKNIFSKHTEDGYFQQLHGKCLNSTGEMLFLKGKYPEALNYHLQAAALFQKADNQQLLIESYVLIGRVYRFQGPQQFPASISELNKAYELAAKNNYSNGMIMSLLELGVLYSDQIYEGVDFDKALGYFQKALTISEEKGNEKYIADIYNSIGWLYSQTGKFQLALDHFDKSINLYKKEGDVSGRLSAIYGIGNCYSNAKDFDLAIAYINEALNIANELKSLDIINNLYELMSSIYYDKKDYEKAYEYYRLSVEVKFELYTNERVAQIADMQTKYETDKKQQEIKLKDAAIKKQTLQRNALIAGLSLVVILVFVIFSSYRRKRKDNFLLEKRQIEIEEKNSQLLLKNEEITSQRDEIEAQRNEIENQRDKIIDQKNEITSSIVYAKQIQQAMLPPSDYLKEFLPDYFILYKPRDIISGDFYWIHHLSSDSGKGKILIAAADCTGHGVPGAFMSMLGVTLLNEILHAFLSEQSGVLNASEILTALSKGVVDSLHQKGNIGEQKDGMDISLCIIDLDLISEGFTPPYYNLQFAGANNPVYLVRPKAEHKSLYDVTEIKGNRRPIGIHSGENKEFTDHNLKIFTGDSLYMFTDGFADQFGGISGRKFRYNQFRDLIDVIQEFDMHKQKEIIETMFEEWKGTHPQTDDILILGIEF